MRVAEHLFEIGLAHVLAVTGLVGSLFLWRAKEINRTVGRVRQVWDAHCAGASPAGRHTRTLVSLLQLGIWTIALGGCVRLTVSMFDFLGLMTTLYEVEDCADVTLLEVLGRRADAMRHDIVISGFLISGLLVLEWVAELVADVTDLTDRSKAPAHLFSLPRQWRDAPAEMWRQRLHAVGRQDNAVATEWLKDWSAWIDVVGAVRDVQ
jgi:hypothetical protein